MSQMLHFRNINRHLQNMIQIAFRRKQDAPDISQSKFGLFFNRAGFNSARLIVYRQLSQHKN